MATVTVFAETTDDYVESSSATYTVARTGGGTLSLPGGGIGASGQNLNAGTFFCWEYFLEFNTASISEADTVVFAIKTNNTVHDPPFIMEARLFDWGGTVTTADWIPGENLGATPLLATLSTNGLADLTLYDFVEQAGAFADSLVFGGTTRIVIASDTLRTGRVPVLDESISLLTADEVGTTDDPRIRVITADTSGDGILNPVADVFIDGWITDGGATTNLFASIDEGTASDTDFVQSAAGGRAANYYETLLEAGIDPSSSSGHTAHYRYQKNTAGGSIDLRVDLRQGSGPTFIKEFGSNEKVSDTSLVVTVPTGGCAAGNTLVGVVATDNASASTPTFTIADTQGNTYSVPSSIITSPTAEAGLAAAIFTCAITTALVAGDSITVTASTAVTAKSITVLEFSGLSTTIETSSLQQGTSTTPSATVTPTSDSAVVIGFIAYEGPVTDGFTNDTDTVSGSWTPLTGQGTSGGNAETNISIKGAYKQINSATAQAYDPVLGTSRDWADIVFVVSASSPLTIASWTHTNISNSWVTQNQALTAPQADAITDYGNLRLRFTPNMTALDSPPTKVADRATANSNVGVTTVDLALASLTVGNYLIIRTAADNSGGGGAARSITLTNQVGTPINTGTIQQFQQNNDPGAASAGATCNFLIAKITATSGTVRLTYSGSVVQACVAEEWSGIHDTTPIVGVPVGAVSTASTNLPVLTDSFVSTGNVSYGVVAVEGPNGDTYTQDADTTNGSWVDLPKLGTTIGTAASNMTTYGGYKVTTGPGAQTYNATINNARDSAGLIVELASAPPVIRTQVSWANLEIPAAAVVSRLFGGQAGLFIFPSAIAVAFGCGDI